MLIVMYVRNDVCCDHMYYWGSFPKNKLEVYCGFEFCEKVLILDH